MAIKTIMLIGHTGTLGSALLKKLQKKHNVITMPDKDCSNDLPAADILINCAGRVKFGSITELSLEEVEDMVVSNIILPWRLAKEFILNGGKHIINIGSTRSFSVAPNKSIYSATKYAIKALTESIHIDYPEIYASLICPGNFTNNKQLLDTVIDAIEFTIEHPETKEIICGGQI